MIPTCYRLLRIVGAVVTDKVEVTVCPEEQEFTVVLYLNRIGERMRVSTPGLFLWLWPWLGHEGKMAESSARWHIDAEGNL